MDPPKFIYFGYIINLNFYVMFGLILAGLSIVAGITAAVVSANAAKHATESANQANADLMREQQQYQTSERLATQEYNTPAAQRQRFEAAGINPYMALGNMNAGNAEMQTGVDTPMMQPAVDGALGSALQSLGTAPQQTAQIVQSVQQVQANDEAVKAARIENIYRQQKELLTLNNMQADINEKLTRMDKNSAEAKSLRGQYEMNMKRIDQMTMELNYAQDYYSARNKRERNMADLAYEQKVGQMLTNRIHEIHAKYAAQLDRAELNRLNAAAANELSGVLANKSLSKLYDQNALTEFELRAYKKAGLKLDNFQKDIALQYIGEQMQVSIDAQKMHMRQANQDYYNPFKYIGGAGAAIGAAFGGALGAGAKGAAAGAASGAGSSYGYGFTNMPTQGAGSMW